MRNGPEVLGIALPTREPLFTPRVHMAEADLARISQLGKIDVWKSEEAENPELSRAGGGVGLRQVRR